MTTALPMGPLNPFVQAKPMVSPAEDNGNSNAQSSGITANDFLTLLVTEMKNQDPTAQTDPNEYINQLVQVNSLEQLIEINQNLSTALGTSNAGASPSMSQNSGHAMGTLGEVSTPINRNSGAGNRYVNVVPENPVPATQGNLGTVSAHAAHRVARALSGRM